MKGLGMAKINRHIEIVSSTITSLSSMSKVSREATQRVLSRYYEHVGITMVDTIADLEALVASGPDLVFLGMKFIPKAPKIGLGGARKIWLAEYLVERGIAVTGSLSLAHKVELNKPLAKKCLLYDGLATSEYLVVRVDQPLPVDALPASYPLFVKPANRGGGVGIDANSVVNNVAELKRKVDSITKEFNSSVLIEKYLTGREFSVAILKDEASNEYSAMPLELVAPSDESGNKILGDKTKTANAERTVPVEEGELRDSLIDLAISSFRSIGGRDYGRIDIRLDDQGVPHFLEANLIPSLIDNYGSFPKACLMNQQMSYEEMLLRIVGLGMSRAGTVSEVQSLGAVTDGLMTQVYS